MTVQFHGKDMSSIICCYSLWLGRAVLHGLCKLSEPLISNWCSNSHRISWWKLSQVPVNPHNPPILCLGVVGRTMVTREASIRIWKGNPRPATILPDCRTGSQSKSLYVRLFLSPWLRSLLVFEMWQITLNDPHLFPHHADLVCLWKGLSHTPSSQAIWKSCNFESVWQISWSGGAKRQKCRITFRHLWPSNSALRNQLVGPLFQPFSTNQLSQPIPNQIFR